MDLVTAILMKIWMPAWSRHQMRTPVRPHVRRRGLSRKLSVALGPSLKVQAALAHNRKAAAADQVIQEMLLGVLAGAQEEETAVAVGGGVAKAGYQFCLL